MRVKRGYLLLIILFFGLPQAAFAGAWTQDKGAFQIISTLSAYRTNRYFDSGSDKKSQPDYKKAELNYYSEYGLYDKFTIGGQLSGVVVQQDSPTRGRGINANISDIELFARKQLWKNNTNVFSIQPSLVIPSFDRKDAFPKIGSDNFSFGLTGNYGHNFKLFNRSHYADFAASYIHRLGEANDQLKFDTSLGFSITDHWTFSPQLFITHSRKPKPNANISLSPADNYDLAKLQISVLYKISDKMEAQFGGFAPIKGKNTGAGHGIIVGVRIQY